MYPKNSVWLKDREDTCYKIIEEIICYQFNNKNLCRQAFIREGYANGNNISGNNEVLEFYGDAVIYLFSSMYFLKGAGVKQELEVPFVCNTGLRKLNSLRRDHVTNDFLAKCFVSMGLDKFIICQQAKHNNKFYGDMLEALIGAVWVDSGFDVEAMNKVVSAIFSKEKPDYTENLDSLKCLKHWHTILYGKPVNIKYDGNKCVIEAIFEGSVKSYSYSDGVLSSSIRKASFEAFRDMRRKLIRLFYHDFDSNNCSRMLKELRKRKIVYSFYEEIGKDNYGRWISTLYCDEFRSEYSNSSREKAINQNQNNILRLLFNDAGIYPAGECKGVVLYRTVI